MISVSKAILNSFLILYLVASVIPNYSRRGQHLWISLFVIENVVKNYTSYLSDPSWTPKELNSKTDLLLKMLNNNFIHNGLVYAPVSINYIDSLLKKIMSTVDKLVKKEESNNFNSFKQLNYGMFRLYFTFNLAHIDLGMSRAMKENFASDEIDVSVFTQFMQ